MTGTNGRGRRVGPARRSTAAWWRQEPLRAAAELGAFAAATPWLRAAPRGDGHPVLVLPGFLADDVSTAPLRGYLTSLGYPTRGWELGRNRGLSRQSLDRAAAALARLADEHGQAVSLVGWSLGGVCARELARRQPRQVRQVITLGSPFRSMGPGRGRRPEPLPVPTTAVFTRTDGVVPWQTCVDEPGRLRENVEVRGSHCGLGHNPAVACVVADRLAQPAGRWTPFRPPALLRRWYPEAQAAA